MVVVPFLVPVTNSIWREREDNEISAELSVHFLCHLSAPRGQEFGTIQMKP